MNWRLLPPELPTGSPAPHKGLIQREVTSVPRGGRERKGGRPEPPGPSFSGGGGLLAATRDREGGAAAQRALGNLGTGLAQPDR